MKIKVCQFVYGDLLSPDSWFSQFVEPVNRSYCEWHGYEYAVDRIETITKIHGHYEKPGHILRNLHDCDYLLYMDADACFYTRELTIENEILLFIKDKSVMLAGDCASEFLRWNPFLPNTGVLLLQNNDTARSIMEHWDHVCGDVELELHRLKDQHMFWKFILPKFIEDIGIERDYYRVQGHFSHFIRHEVGRSEEHRHREFEKIFKRVFGK